MAHFPEPEILMKSQRIVIRRDEINLTGNQPRVVSNFLEQGRIQFPAHATASIAFAHDDPINIGELVKTILEVPEVGAVV